MEITQIRDFNYGASNYSKKKIQPWDLWTLVCDPFRCDVIKRILRQKEGELLDMRKVEHVLLKIKDLMGNGHVFLQYPFDHYGEWSEKYRDSVFAEEGYGNACDKGVILDNMFKDPNDMSVIDESLGCVRRYIQRLEETENSDKQN